jgi:acyl-homoserine-lactone acylase
MKIHHLVIVPILCSVIVGCFNQPKTSSAKNESEILWDKWGIPHIYADNMVDAFYAQGWAMTQSHGNLMMKLYGEVRGRASEYWGGEYLAHDKKYHRLGVPNWGEAAYRAQTPEIKALLDAFAAGVNAYSAENPQHLNKDMRQVLPITAQDLLAHFYRIYYVEFVAGKDIDPQWPFIQSKADQRRKKVAGLDVPLKNQKEFSQEFVGSNSWAVSPRKSASGNAMLLANPHLPWYDFFLFYESHLSVGDLNASGVSLVGLPGLEIAFTQHLGWSHTVNSIDASDRYDLQLKDGGYVLDGEVKPFSKRYVTLKIKQADGSFLHEPLEIKTSVHGPVIEETENAAVALKLPAKHRYGIYEQYFKMLTATNLDQFISALDMRQVPYFNIMYADKNGEIFYISNGLFPIRDQGDFSFWKGSIPGDDSAYLWTSLYERSAYPQLRNPKSGALQNANDMPWTSTIPMELRAADYPATFAAGESMHFRAQHSARMLMSDNSITFDEMYGYQQSTVMELADHVLDSLVPSALKSNDPLLREVGKILSTWDRTSNFDAVGAVIFVEWVRKMKGSIFADRWDPAKPFDTPTVLKDEQQALTMLGAAAQQVKQDYQRLDIPWGEVYRIRYGTRDLPASGDSTATGSFRVAAYKQDGDKKYQQFHGDSYVAVVEFGDKIKARGLLSYGNSSEQGSPHNGDQLELFSKKQWRDIAFTREQVEAVVRRRESLRR